jgi:hypothetical protein
MNVPTHKVRAVKLCGHHETHRVLNLTPLFSKIRITGKGNVFVKFVINSHGRVDAFVIRIS